MLNLHLERAVLATLDFALSAEDRSFDSPELRANLDRLLAGADERRRPIVNLSLLIDMAASAGRRAHRRRGRPRSGDDLRRARGPQPGRRPAPPAARGRGARVHRDQPSGAARRRLRRRRRRRALRPPQLPARRRPAGRPRRPGTRARSSSHDPASRRPSIRRGSLTRDAFVDEVAGAGDEGDAGFVDPDAVAVVHLHQRDDGGAQGRAAAPPPPDGLRAEHGRAGGRPGPTRRRSSPCPRTTWPAWPTCSPTSTPAGASSTSTASTPARGSTPCAATASPTPWSCRRCWPASSTSSATPPRRTCPPCGPCPTAAPARRLRSSNGPCGRSRTSASSTPTASPRPVRRSPSSDPRTTAGRWCRATPRCGPGSAPVGRLLPGIEIEIRGEDGTPVAPGGPGLIFLRGEQVSGEYGGVAARRRRRLVRHPRPGVARRRRLPVRRGPGRRHHHPGRRERRARRDRGRAPGPPRRRRRGRRRPARRRVGPADRGRRRDRVRTGRSPRTSCGPSPGRGCGRRRPPIASCSAPELPRTDTGKLLRRVVLAEVSTPDPVTGLKVSGS